MLGVGRDGPTGGGTPTGQGAVRAATDGTALVRDARAPRIDQRAARIEAERRRQREAWAVLAATEGLGPVGLVALVEAFGDAVSVVEAARSQDGMETVRAALGRRPGLSARLPDRVVRAALTGDTVLESMRRSDVDVLMIDEPEYPPLLAAIELPPPVLFIRGAKSALSEGHVVAVVGTRRPTDDGRATAGRIAGAIARTGAVVTSGLAIGIDGVAHSAALGVGGTTVAVIGGGHDRAVPRAHRRLADQIVAEGGAVVSEHAPDTIATRGTFPRRNRVISGLASATVVVEAGSRSGALITAGWALEQGRECFLVAGALGAPASAGCLAFLRAYGGEARVVAGIGELIEDLGLVDHLAGPSAGDRRAELRSGGAASRLVAVPGPKAVLGELPAPVAAVARAFTGHARTADELVSAVGLPIPAVLAALTLLEDLGLVRASYGRYRLAGPLVDSA